MNSFFRPSLLILALFCCVLAPGAARAAMDGAQASNLVRGVYRDVLQRNPDPTGLTEYAQHLMAGRDERWLAAQLRHSSEYRVLRLRALLPRARTAGLLLGLLGLAALAARITSRAGPWRLAGVALFTALFPALYFFWIGKYGVDIPFWDDFDSILLYLIQGFPQRLLGLAAQANEHRVVTTRLVAELSDLLLGRVDFRFMSLLGNAALLGILALFFREWRRHALPLPYLPVLSAILFTPLAWDNMTWAMPAVQNNVVHLCAFLALAFYFDGRRRAAGPASVVSAAATAFSSASGILVFPALLATHLAGALFPADRPPAGPGGRRAWDAGLVAGGMVLVALLYAHGYEKPPHHPDLLSALARPGLTLQFFLTFLGGGVPGGTGASLVLGSCLALLGLLFTIQRGYARCPALYGMMIYLFLCAAAIALGRAGFGLERALDNRYRITPLILLAILLALGVRLNARWFRHPAVHLALLFAALANFTWAALAVQRPLRDHRRVLIRETAKWVDHRGGLRYPKEGRLRAGAQFDQAVSNGIYRIPAAVLEEARTFHP